jgi:S1-C subfamily serine protease
MSFALKKIPVLFLFSGLHADYHRPSDDADKINYQGIADVVDFAADVVRQIDASPRQAYVDAADSASMHMGMPGSPGSGRGPRVSLGVVPDYTAVDEGGGVRIGGTTPGSPAAGAGLKNGDVLVKFDGRKLDTLYDLTDALARSKPGQRVKIELLRDGQAIDVEVTLAERKG